MDLSILALGTNSAYMRLSGDVEPKAPSSCGHECAASDAGCTRTLHFVVVSFWRPPTLADATEPAIPQAFTQRHIYTQDDFPGPLLAAPRVRASTSHFANMTHSHI